MEFIETSFLLGNVRVFINPGKRFDSDFEVFPFKVIILNESESRIVLRRTPSRTFLIEKNTNLVPYIHRTTDLTRKTTDYMGG